MTGPAADDVRGQLAEALAAHIVVSLTGVVARCSCGWVSDSGWVSDLLARFAAHRDHIADALLPAVSRIADQAAADALREAADDFTQAGFESVRTDSVDAHLRARAARLAPPTDPKEQP